MCECGCVSKMNCACVPLCVCCLRTYSIYFCGANTRKHALYIFAQMFRTTKVCSCSNKCSLPQSRCWLTLMRAVCEEYTSKWHLKACPIHAPSGSLEILDHKKRLSYQPHYLMFNSFLLCAWYFSEHMMYVNLFIIKIIKKLALLLCPLAGQKMEVTLLEDEKPQWKSPRFELRWFWLHIPMLLIFVGLCL